MCAQDSRQQVALQTLLVNYRKDAGDTVHGAFEPVRVKPNAITRVLRTIPSPLAQQITLFAKASQVHIRSGYNLLATYNFGQNGAVKGACAASHHLAGKLSKQPDSISKF